MNLSIEAFVPPWARGGWPQSEDGEPEEDQDAVEDGGLEPGKG